MFFLLPNLPFFAVTPNMVYLSYFSVISSGPAKMAACGANFLAVPVAYDIVSSRPSDVVWPPPDFLFSGLTDDVIVKRCKSILASLLNVP